MTLFRTVSTLSRQPIKRVKAFKWRRNGLAGHSEGISEACRKAAIGL